MLMVLEEVYGERSRVFKLAVVRAAPVPLVLTICAICARSSAEVSGVRAACGLSRDSQSLGAVSCVMASGAGSW